MARSPVVRRMVMFKHGVAYLERSGPADGSFELSFKRDEMNDVLKSLAVWVAEGDARVGAVAFEKPEDPEQALAQRKLLLPAGGALHGLLGSLRGRRVALDAGGVRHEGEVVGVQITPAGDGAERQTLVLRAADGRVSLLALAGARGLELLEAPSRADLEFLVDRSRAATAGDSRTVSVSLSGRAEDLRVSYVIPAPVWRVSYRLARGAGGTTLMAWGIVHNPADEDLEEIDLTLTTGQPVSFVIDLYNPKTVKRAVVEETSRAAAAPVQYERAPLPPPAPAAAAPMGGPPGFGPPPPPAPAAKPAMRMAASFGASGEGAADYADRGELFEYRVTTKVSLKRGGSAMVPLLAAKLEARKERIWRPGMPPPPDLVLQFANNSGAVLEEGPAVVYDEDVYAGEAMLPYSARGVDVKVGFAKDLGVRCQHRSTSRSVAAGISLGEQYVLEQYRWEEEHRFTAQSDHAEPVDLVFELPKNPHRALAPENAQPFEETLSFRRFRVTVPPRGQAEVIAVERWVASNYVQYNGLNAAVLENWLRERFLDRATAEHLARVLEGWTEAQRLDQQRAQVERDQAEAYTKQKKLSEQLAVLKDGGAEGNLRLRYVRELEAEQDRVNRCETEARRLREAAADAKQRADAELARLVSPRPPAPAPGR